ncbi:MAG: hypothetical protein HYY84_04955 [Deltaproteobacteria bacterium]|nr:hypothetical protein [Deltaproteobacteria bacterium]
MTPWLRVVAVLLLGVGFGGALACSASIPEIRLYIEPSRGFVDTSTIDSWMRSKGSFGGRYFGLISAIKEPDDQRTYGKVVDWGYWPGGTWGKLTGSPAGYYTYVYPYWLVWRGRN